MRDVQVIRWTRLDRPGTDVCRMFRDEDGWMLDGRAESRGNPGAYALDYQIRCDAAWKTRRAEVEGQVEMRPFRFLLERAGDGDWCLDGRPGPHLEGGHDIDLGFTPATNTVAIRRLSLSPGSEAPSVAVWLDETDWQAKCLRQGYARLSETGYRYISPDNGFEAFLAVNAAGFVLDYPGLWLVDAS